jgi:hypothetical protein
MPDVLLRYEQEISEMFSTAEMFVLRNKANYYNGNSRPGSKKIKETMFNFSQYDFQVAAAV